MERNIQESRDLTESRRDLKTALGETEGPLRVTKECLYKRKKRRVKINMDCGYTLDTLVTLYTLNNLFCSHDRYMPYKSLKDLSLYHIYAFKTFLKPSNI